MTLDPLRVDSIAPGTAGFPITKAFARISNLSVFTLVASICAIHVIISVWQAYVMQVNNDGILYAHAAKLFAEGRFAEARALFSWFSYPLLIGGMAAATGLDAVVAARLADGIASTVTVLVILRSAWVCFPNRMTLLCGGALLLGNLWFNELRVAVVREHFYFLFVILGFYCQLRDLQTPRAAYKIGFVAATAAAALFRIEADGFLLFVPVLRLLFETRSRTLRAVACAVLLGGPLCAIAVLAYWSDLGSVAALLARPLGRIAVLRDQVLWPYQFRNAGFAYAIMIAGLWLYALINSVGLAVIALVGFGAFESTSFRRSVPLYIALIYFIVGAVALAVQAYFNLFLDPRHGLVLSLILTVPATIAFVNLLPFVADPAQRWPRTINGFVIVMLIIGLLAGVRYYDSHAYWITAGQWLAKNTSREARAVGNNNQVLFYGGFDFADPELVTRSGSHTLSLSDHRNWKNYDLVVLELRKDQLNQVADLEKEIGQPPTTTFENSRGDKILIYKLR